MTCEELAWSVVQVMTAAVLVILLDETLEIAGGGFAGAVPVVEKLMTDE